MSKLCEACMCTYHIPCITGFLDSVNYVRRERDTLQDSIEKKSLKRYQAKRNDGGNHDDDFIMCTGTANGLAHTRNPNKKCIVVVIL